jgi:lipopolysaccharide/colanic/teichoic acid biosynthesis glycosyltransferase
MVKRLFDVLVGAAALLLLSPLFLGVAIAIKLSSPGPIFYRAVRVGRHGVLFKLYKFRSMVVNADKIGAGITTAHDPRITPIGRFLRRTKLDELPQLINVLRGEMSLVGPRPEDPRYVALYTEAQRRVLRARPGMTSLASVRYRNEQALLSGADWETRYIQQIMPDKLAIDLQYMERATLLSDLGVLWQTFLALFR